MTPIAYDIAHKAVFLAQLNTAHYLALWTCVLAIFLGMLSLACASEGQSDQKSNAKFLLKCAFWAGVIACACPSQDAVFANIDRMVGIETQSKHHCNSRAAEWDNG